MSYEVSVAPFDRKIIIIPMATRIHNQAINKKTMRFAGVGRSFSLRSSTFSTIERSGYWTASGVQRESDFASLSFETSFF